MSPQEQALVARLRSCRLFLKRLLLEDLSVDQLADIKWRLASVVETLAGPQPGCAPCESELARELGHVNHFCGLWENDPTIGDVVRQLRVKANA